MNALGWLVLGLLIGWAIEFAIDFLYWRKKAQEEAEALAQQESVLLAQQTELGHRQATLRLREKEMADLQASLASRDAELLQQARRVKSAPTICPAWSRPSRSAAPTWTVWA